MPERNIIHSPQWDFGLEFPGVFERVSMESGHIKAAFLIKAQCMGIVVGCHHKQFSAIVVPGSVNHHVYQRGGDALLLDETVEGSDLANCAEENEGNKPDDDLVLKHKDSFHSGHIDHCASNYHGGGVPLSGDKGVGLRSVAFIDSAEHVILCFFLHDTY